MASRGVRGGVWSPGWLAAHTEGFSRVSVRLIRLAAAVVEDRGRRVGLHGREQRPPRQEFHPSGGHTILTTASVRYHRLAASWEPVASRISA